MFALFGLYAALAPFIELRADAILGIVKGGVEKPLKAHFGPLLLESDKLLIHRDLVLCWLHPN